MLQHFFVITHLGGAMGAPKVTRGRFEVFPIYGNFHKFEELNRPYLWGMGELDSESCIFEFPTKKCFQSVGGYFLIIFPLEKVIQGSLFLTGVPK